MKLASGHTYEEWDPKKKEAYRKTFRGPNADYINLQPGKFVVPRNYLKFQEKVYNFKFRPTDVVIMGVPKSGTNWVQEILWTMLHNPNLDNPVAEGDSTVKTAFLEGDMFFGGYPEPVKLQVRELFSKICPSSNPDEGFQFGLAATLPDRRVVKTHFPFSLLDPSLLSTAKVIYVARNPKDACLSFLHQHKVFKPLDYSGTQDEFVEHYVNGDVQYGAFPAIINEAWAKRDHPNMHFVFFEDLKADIDGELKKIDKFLGTGLTDQQLQNVKKPSSFKNMKAKDPLNKEQDKSKTIYTEAAQKEGGFFNKGVSGGWREKLTKEQSDKIDAYVKKYYDPTGLTFKF